MTDMTVPIGPDSDGMDMFQREFERQRQKHLRNTLMSASLQDPQKALQTHKYGLSLDTPQSVLQQTQQNYQGMSLYERVRQQPTTASLFMDERFAFIAAPDVDRISGWESLWRVPTTAFVDAVAGGMRTLEAGSGLIEIAQLESAVNKTAEFLARPDLPAEQRELAEAQLAKSQRRLDLAMQGQRPVPSTGFWGRGEMEARAGAPIFQSVRKSIESFADAIRFVPRDIYGEVASSAGQSASISIPLLFTFGPAGAMLGFALSSYGAASREAEELGGDLRTQAGRGARSSFYELALGSLPVFQMFGRAAAGVGLRQNLIRTISAEIPTEIATEVVDIIDRRLTFEGDDWTEDLGSELGRASLVTALSTVLSVGVTTTALHKFGASAQRYQQNVDQAKGAANALQQSGDIIQQSTVLKQAPDILARVGNAVAEATDTQGRRIDVDTFMSLVDQLGGEQRVRSILPNVMAQVDDLGTGAGQEIVLSAGEYAAQIQSNPDLRTVLEPHIRVGFNEMSATEAQQAEESTDEFLGVLNQRLGEEADARKKQAEEERAIRDQIVGAVLQRPTAQPPVPGQPPAPGQEPDVLEAPRAPSVTPEQDAAYMEAVESGGTQAQQAAVDQAAEAAGYTVELYHGTTKDFDTFERGSHFGSRRDAAIDRLDFVGAPQESRRVVRVRANLQNTIRLEDGEVNSLPRLLRAVRDGKYPELAEAASRQDIYSVQDLIEAAGFDSAVYENNIEDRGVDSYLIVDPSRVKSAEAITRDADGNVIPLSQRFDVAQPSILYAPPTKRGDEYSSWAEEMAAIQQRASGEQPKGALSKVADSAKEWLAGIRKRFAGGVFSDAFTRAERTGDVETGRKLVEAAAMQAGKFVFPANHGLREGILRGAEFDVSLLGKNTGAASAAEGVFTSKGFHTALRYAVPPAKKSAIPISNERVNVELYKALDNLIYEKEDQYGHKMVVGHGHFVRANMSTPAAPMPDIITEYSTEYKKRRRLGPTYEPLITRAMSPVQVAEKLETARSQLVLSASRANPKNASLIREVAKKIQVIINQVNADYDLQPSEISATGYRGVLQLYVIFDNPYIFDQKGELGRATTYYEIIKQAKADGHDGVIIKNTFDGSSVDDVYVAFSPTQMKSAEPFTYDKNGKLIPLQKRFDLSTPSVLYGPEDLAPGQGATREQIETQAEIAAAMFSRLAGMLGMSPTKMWETFGPRITQELEGLTPEERAKIAGESATYWPKTMTVILGKSQTASSLIHELTHHYLHILQTIALQPQGDNSDINRGIVEAGRWLEEILAEFDTTGEMAAKGFSATEWWRQLSVDKKQVIHERFAYQFEKYLGTGKAPTEKLRSAFSKARRWLSALYGKTLLALDQAFFNRYNERLGAMTPEVTAIFDKLLGSEIAIAKAVETDGAIPLFQTQEESGLTDEQWGRLQDARQRRDDEAVAKMMARFSKDMRWTRRTINRFIRKTQRDVKKERARIRSEVESDVAERPVYRATRLFRQGLIRNAQGELVKVEGPHRLDIAIIKERFESLNWKSLGFGRNGMLGKDGVDPDVVAADLGFANGDELVNELIGAAPMRDIVDQLTEQRMLAEKGEMLDPRAVEAAAIESIRNEHQARVTSLEASFLDEATRPAQALRRAAKVAAAKKLATMAIEDIRPDRFALAAKRASKAAFLARREGRNADAFAAKREQLAMEMAHLEAKAIRKKVEAQKKKLRNLRGNAKNTTLGPDYADRINTILSKIALDAQMPIRALETQVIRASLESHVDVMRERAVPSELMTTTDRIPPVEPDVPRTVLDEINAMSVTNVKNMTLEQFSDIMRVVDELVHHGRRLVADEMASSKAKFSKTVEALAADAAKNSSKLRVGAYPLTAFDRAKAFIKTSLLESPITAQAKAWVMDGGRYGGSHFDVIINPASKIADAQVAEQAVLTEKLQKILEPIYAAGRSARKKVFRPEINESKTTTQIVFAAANMLNEGNEQRLVDGEQWGVPMPEMADQDQQDRVYQQRRQNIINLIQNHLTADQVRIAQQLSDVFTDLKPRIAKESRETVGAEPKWIDPRPITFQMASGESVTLRGGYFPIEYDPFASTVGSQRNQAKEAEAAKMMSGVSATTSRAYTKSRVNKIKGAPLLLDPSVVTSALDEILQDLYWRRWAMDMNRLMRKGNAWYDTVQANYGSEWIADLVSWRNRTASGGVVEFNNKLKRAASLAGKYVSQASLLFNPISVAMQPVGMLAVRTATGQKHATYGHQRVLTDLPEAYREMMAASPQMATRYLTRNRELREVNARIRGKNSARAQVEVAGWMLMQTAQSVADVAAWQAGYHMAVEQGHAPDKAADIAYQVVLDTQSSGRIQDLSEVEAGTIGYIFGSFYRPLNAQYNLAARKAIGAKEYRRGLVGDMAMLFVLMPYLIFMLKRFLRQPEEGDPEFWTLEAQAKLIASETGRALLGNFIGYREVSEIVPAMLGDEFYNYSGPAKLRIIPDLMNLGAQVGQAVRGLAEGDTSQLYDESMIRSLANVFGDAVGFPVAGVTGFVRGIDAALEGEVWPFDEDGELPPWTILFGTQK